MLKESFFVAMAIFIPAALLLWFSIALGKSFLGMFRDWQLGREVDELHANRESRDEQRAAANAARLDNGCEHDFDTGAHGLPPNTCRKCGLQREKPHGPCDHVWRPDPGPVPRSVCEKCGRKYSVTEQLA